MDKELVMNLVLRWVHIASACIAVGAPFFLRFALLPAAEKTLQPEQFQALKETINARWRIIVYLLITVFILTGLYNFLVIARWKSFVPSDKSLYHMLFGIKTLAAFVVFFLASALAGRSKTFAPIRRSPKFWTTILLLNAALIIICGSYLRQLPLHSLYLP